MSTQHVRVELYRLVTDAGGTQYRWAVERDPDDDTASAAYARDPIDISYGGGPEQGEPTPSTATLTFKGHEYNPENPASDLYGLIGPNTPIRIQAGEQPAQETTFDYSATDTWDGGTLTWTLAGGSAGDFDVNGSAGVITHPDANVLRYATVDTGETDHRVRAVFELSASDLTGAGASVWVLGRFADTGNYYAALVAYNTSEVATVGLYKRVAGVLTQIATPVTVPETGIGGGGFDLVAELYVEGNRLYASCWRRSTVGNVVDEPLTWMVSAEDDDLTAGTRGGVTGRRETGSTNANLQMLFHDFAAIPGTIRFAGEAADWRPRSDTGGDRWVEVEAGGPLQRLQSPQADVLRSALWRENLFNNPVAMWPITDGADAPYAASALPGGAPMSIQSLDWATSALVPLDWEPVAYNAWVEPIATPALDTQLTFFGPVTMDSAVTEWAADFVCTMTSDADNFGGSLLILTDIGSGTAGDPRVDWLVQVQPDADWAVMRQVWTGAASDPTFTLIASGEVDISDGRIHHVRFKTVRDGSDVDWELLIDNTTIDAGTLVGSDWGPLARAQGVVGTGTAGQTSMGFITIWDTASPPANAANAAVVGRSGELAGARFLRLLGEEGIAAEVIGETAGVDTEAMGPQLIDTLASNLASIVAVDMGLMYDTRHQVGVTYRYRTSLYGPAQNPVTLDATAGGEVAPPLEPVVGTLGVLNDVTAKRPNGSSARSVAESGPLNVNPRSTDPEGVGRYSADFEVNVDLDDQLQGVADWRRFRGTQKTVRYPKVTVKFGAFARDGKTALATSVNRLRIGDRLDLANAEPTGVTQIVPGYTETIGPSVAERKITFNGVPANVYEVGVFNDGASKYDSAYSTTAASFVAGTDTSLSVATEAGRSLWVTGSGSPQFPIDLNVAGCRLRVTAISGAASPQTFTVNATVVNGITKTIASGTQVRLWAPRRYGL